METEEMSVFKREGSPYYVYDFIFKAPPLNTSDSRRQEN
jgi:hypothetical protein